MSEPAAAPEWRRLDPRMLLVQPILELGKFIPPLAALIIAGTASGLGPWTLLGVGVPIALGVVRYLTTTYRITPALVELRRGLLQRHTTSTPLDRVRTVDMSATLIHRVLGLATVVIGTGSSGNAGSDQLSLDGLPAADAESLRRDLLQRAAVAASDSSAGDVTDPDPVPPPDHVVARFSARWIWYAPFTGAGFVVIAAAFGLLGQFYSEIESLAEARSDDLESLVAGSIGLLVVIVSFGALALMMLAVIAGYVVTNWDFRLGRDSDAWHIRRGLFTTRETSLDQDRVAGVVIGEQAALRVARGGRLAAIATGLRRGDEGASVLVPPAPASTVRSAAEQVLGSAAAVTGPLRGHGPAAVRRRYARSLLGTMLPVVIALTGLTLAGVGPWIWLLAGAALVASLLLAHDRAAGLGHAVIDGYVVLRAGSLTRRRTVLAADHVIGWTLRDTWFQRRLGLSDVTATTAGGAGQAGVPDVPTDIVLDLTEVATAGLLAQFTTSRQEFP